MSAYLFSIPQPAEVKIRQFAPRALLPQREDSLWQIQTGVVRSLTWLDDETISTIGLWGTGDIVGKVLSTIELLQFECLTKVEAKVVPMAQLHQETAALLAHIQQTEALMLIRSQRRIDAMLIKLLTWLAKKFGQQVESGHLIDLRLTHQDLAELLGTTRVTITRTLNQLEQQGLIRRLPLQRIVLNEEDLWHYEI